MSTYLVTGGAGFIGSHIAEALVSEGHGVRVLDNLSTGKRENLRTFNNGITLIEGDIRDAEVVANAVRGVDYVIHQAALASVPRSIEDPSSTNEVNVQGTLNLLESARKGSVKRFVYASSSSVYGDSEVLPKTEAMFPEPKSPYAVSKLAGEYYCGVYSKIHGLPTVSLRYFNVFGPRQDPSSQYAAVVPIFVSSLLAGRSATIFGDGEQSRDFTYVSNVVAANLLVCHATSDTRLVYNVACGERFTLNSLYKRLENITGIGLDPTYGDPRVGDVKHSQAAIEAIQGDVGYAPTVGFDDGLELTCEWYRQAI
jgi:UDP-glucose 4-epimerase